MDALLELFSKLHELDALIRWGGYTLLFAIVFAETGLLMGFFLPGDSLLLTAGLLASVEGSPLAIGPLLAVLSAAAVLGDSTGYAIGAYVGPRIFRREESRFFHRRHLLRAQRFYEKHGVKTIVLARFAPIVRTFAPTLAGVGRMHYPTFLAFNLIGGVAWVSSMTLAGYALGTIIPNGRDYFPWIVIGVIVLSLLALRIWKEE